MEFCLDDMDNLLGKIRAEGFDKQQLYWVPKQVIQRIHKRPFTKEFTVTCLGYFPSAASHVVERPKGLAQALLIFVEKGAGWVSMDGQKRAVEAGQVLHIPANVPHSYGASHQNPWSIFWFHFDGAGALGLLGWTTLTRNNPVMDCAAWDGLRRQFRSLFNTIERGYHEHTLLEMSRVLINVITLLHRNPTSERPNNASHRIEQAMDKMRDTLTAPFTLVEYAASAGYSVARFSHWFKLHTGISPMTYLNELRVQKACEYLDTTALSIKEISVLLGYEDPLYFSRSFQKCTGQSPSSYRERK